jgi:predicted RNA-binding Zn ribbon-like protein
MRYTYSMTEPEADFLFHYGTLALAFGGTLGRRPAQPIERLGSPERLAAWFTAAGLLSVAPAVSASDYARALRVRSAILRAGDAIAAARAPEAADIMLLNEMAAPPPVGIALAPDGAHTVRTGKPPVRAALSSIARDAIDLFGGERRALITSCEADDCRALLLDDSRGKRRRWCSMERCGNRAKVAAFRSRQRGD